MSDNKVLHRKMFRQKALRAGHIQPQGAMVGGINFFLNAVSKAGPGALRGYRAFKGSRVGKGAIGFGEAIEAPLGAQMLASGAEEGNYGEMGLGAGFGLLGLGRFFPGLKGVRDAFRRVPKSRRGQQAQARADQKGILESGQKKLKGLPGLGRVVKFSEDKPKTAFAGALGLGGAGFAADKVLGDPQPLKDSKLGDKDKATIKALQESKKKKDFDVKEDLLNIEEVDVGLPQTQGATDAGFEVGGGGTKPAETLTTLAKKDMVKRQFEANQIKNNDDNATVSDKGNAEGKRKLNGTNSLLNYLQENSQRLSPMASADIQGRLNRAFAKSFEEIETARGKLKDREKETFDEYMNKFKEYSGADNDKRGYYLLWQLGSGLANAKTTRGGYAGFLESLNQAGGEVFETAFALNQQDMALRKSLAANFIDYERNFEEQQRLEGKSLDIEKRNLIQLMASKGLEMEESERDFLYNRQKDILDFQVSLMEANAKGGKQKELTQIYFQDPMGIENIKTLPAAIGEDGILRVQYKDQNGQIAFYEPGELKEIFPALGGTRGTDYALVQNDPGASAKAFTSMTFNRDGWTLIDDIQKMEDEIRASGIDPEQVLGSGGAIYENFNKLLNFGKGVLTTVGIDFGGRKSEGTYEDIIAGNDLGDVKQFITSSRAGDDNKGFATEDAVKDTDAISLKQFNEMYAKDKANVFSPERMNSISKEVFSGTKFNALKDDEFSTGAEKRRLIARLSVYQHKLKYLIANALKAEDRLTQADIADAAGQTSLKDVFKRLVEIREQMKVQKEILEKNFSSSYQRFVRTGGQEVDMISFDMMPSVAKSFKLRDQQKRKALVQQQDPDGEIAAEGLLGAIQ